MSSQDEIKNIQDTLDEHKQSMPGEVYKQLCNVTIEAFNKKKVRNNKKYYKVQYVYTYTQFATKIISSTINEVQYELDTKIHTGEIILEINDILLNYDSDSDSFRIRSIIDEELKKKFIDMIKKNNIIFSSDYNLQHSDEVTDINLLVNNEVHIISYKLLNKS